MVSGVSSCYAVKPSALQKTKTAMSPCGSLAQSHYLTMPTPSLTDKARHGRRGPPPCRPAVGKTLHDTTKHARNPHAQPTRLVTTANDNADSASQMSKSPKNTQEMHKSAMSPPALAGRPIHRLMIQDESQQTRYTARAFDELDQLLD